MQELGYLPEAVINWVSLMGWSYDDHTEFFTLPDLVEKFSLNHLNPSPAAINFSKLDHFNGLHIRALPVEELARRIKLFFVNAGYQVDDEKLLAITPLIQERLGVLSDATDLAGFLFEEDIVLEDERDLVARDMSAAECLVAARQAYEILKSANDLTVESIEPQMRALVEQLGENRARYLAFSVPRLPGEK
jgi:glutamyl-tRNA synthetase